MRKILFAGIITVLCAAYAAAAVQPKIAAINIRGLVNVKEKTVIAQLQSRKGKPYSEETVKKDLQTILGLGYFDDVEVAVDTAPFRIQFTVKEKAYLKKIVFKGNKKYSAGRLKDEMTLKEKEYYDVGKLEESKAKVLALYRDKGYADVKIEVYPTVDEPKNHMTLSLLVTEGNRILIGEVTVTGAAAYTPKKILGLMKTKKKKVFKEETLLEDRAAIERFYKNNGYMKVQLGETNISYNTERTQMHITLPVTEGARYRIGRISFSGAKVFTDAALTKSLQLKKSDLYNEDKLQESRIAILEQYSDRGYLHASVDPSFTPAETGDSVDIAFAITENDIVYIGAIYIDGLMNTKEYVIRRELMLKEGDVFAASKVRRSIEKIYNLGFIDAVEPMIQPTERKDTMDLVMNITEGKPGMLSAGAGYSSVDQLVGTLQVQHVNLFGRAQRLNLMWEFGARKQNYEIDWTEPWFMRKPMTFGVSVFDTERTRDYGTTYNAYTEARTGGSVRIGPRLNDNLSLLFSYSYEAIEIDPVDDLAETIAANVDISNGITSSILSQVIWDTRDNIFDASRGNRQSLSVQYAGGPLGGTENFIKPIARTSWYFPTFWKFVLSLNGSVGAVENFSPSDGVPIYERFYVGGAESVRGYKYRGEIGPEEGGKLMTVCNVEYKFPIVQEKNRSVLQGAFFFDAGGCWRSANEFSTKFGTNENNLKAGFGFGIRFTTPVFPLRLDWGYGLNHNPGEELSQFYFTIGNIF